MCATAIWSASSDYISLEFDTSTTDSYNCIEANKCGIFQAFLFIQSQLKLYGYYNFVVEYEN